MQAKEIGPGQLRFSRGSVFIVVCKVLTTINVLVVSASSAPNQLLIVIKTKIALMLHTANWNSKHRFRF